MKKSHFLREISSQNLGEFGKRIKTYDENSKKNNKKSKIWINNMIINNLGN